MTAVAGESGSGKTTLARMMLGFIDPSHGQVLYRGKDVAKMTGAEQRQFRREVQPIFQDPFDVFNPFYRVDHVLETPVKRFKLADSEAKRAGADRGCAEARRPAPAGDARPLPARAVAAASASASWWPAPCCCGPS